MIIYLHCDNKNNNANIRNKIMTGVVETDN